MEKVTAQTMEELGFSRQTREFTQEEIDQKEAICFPVHTVPMNEVIEDMKTTNALRNLVVVEPRSGGQKVVNVMSDIYGLVPIRDIIDPIEKGLREKFNIVPVYKSFDDCKFFVDYIIQDKNGMGKDILNPKIRIQHSYSGDVKYGLKLGFWRQVCSNGMGVETEMSQKMKKKHTVGNMFEVAADTMDYIEEFVANMDAYVEPYKLLQKKTVISLEERLKMVVEVTKFPKKYLPDVLERVQYEQGLMGGKMNDWLIYNGFNFQLNHNQDMQMQEQNRVAVDESILQLLLQEV